MTVHMSRDDLESVINSLFNDADAIDEARSYDGSPVDRILGDYSKNKRALAKDLRDQK